MHCSNPTGEVQGLFHAEPFRLHLKFVTLRASIKASQAYIVVPHVTLMVVQAYSNTTRLCMQRRRLGSVIDGTSQKWRGRSAVQIPAEPLEWRRFYTLTCLFKKWIVFIELKPLNRLPNEISQKIDCRNIDRMFSAKENLPRSRQFSIPTYSLSCVSQVIQWVN